MQAENHPVNMIKNSDYFRKGWSCIDSEKAARIISQSVVFFATESRGKKGVKKEILRASRGTDRMCVPLGETERGLRSCVCVGGWGGGVGQTARNRGNRGHGVSAEIKKERKPLCKLQRDDGERVGLARRKG